jgi:hypothetical protein
MKGISKRQQQSLLGIVFELMSETGLEEGEIRLAVDAALSRLQRSGRGNRAKKCGPCLLTSDISAELMRVWHRDSRYLDPDHAQPRPLHVAKGRNSIQSIVLKLNPRAKVHDVVNFLLESKLVRKLPDGKYVPTSDVGMISQVNRFVVDHLIKSIDRMIRTIRRNSQLGVGKGLLIERFASVPDLDRKEVEAFREFTEAQGHSYLQVVDDWMERRRMRNKRKRSAGERSGVMAGVHVIAFLGEEAGGGSRGSVLDGVARK